MVVDDLSAEPEEAENVAHLYLVPLYRENGSADVEHCTDTIFLLKFLTALILFTCRFVDLIYGH